MGLEKHPMVTIHSQVTPLLEQASNTFDKLYSIAAELPYAVYEGKPVKE